jgi:uncharacterized repeat protein (TIGR01451 family)
MSPAAPLTIRQRERVAKRHPKGPAPDVPVTSHPVFGFNKTVTEVINPDGSIAAETVVDEAGDTIKYTMRVSNLGNVTLTGVAIADPLLKANPANNVTLAVDEAIIFSRGIYGYAG